MVALKSTKPTCAHIYVPKLFMRVLEFRRLLECTGYSEPSLLAYTSTIFYSFYSRRSRRDIVLASSVCPSVHSVHPSTLCLSGTISQYLLVKFDSILVQMISTIDSRYPISLVEIDSLTLELLPLF